jgi:anoctamin-10
VSLLNNLLELRSDAFKMTVHHRRPTPTRADTIGPWLDALTLLTWFGAMMNAALVYLFSPQILHDTSAASRTSDKVSEAVASIIANNTQIIEQLTSTSSLNILGSASFLTKKQLLFKAALVALLASHGFILVRLVVKQIVEKAYWRCSKELEMRDKEIRQTREKELEGRPTGTAVIKVEKVIIKREVIPSSRQEDGEGIGDTDDEMRFWEEDEGIEEIRRILKEA